MNYAFQTLAAYLYIVAELQYPKIECLGQLSEHIEVTWILFLSSEGYQKRIVCYEKITEGELRCLM